MSAVAYAMYEVIDEYLVKILKKLPNNRLIVVGGIQINMMEPIEDMFVPISFKVYENNKNTLDLSNSFK